MVQGYCVFASVIWPCIPSVVPAGQVGTAYGLVTAFQAHHPSTRAHHPLPPDPLSPPTMIVPRCRPICRHTMLTPPLRHPSSLPLKSSHSGLHTLRTLRTLSELWPDQHLHTPPPSAHSQNFGLFSIPLVVGIVLDMTRDMDVANPYRGVSLFFASLAAVGAHLPCSAHLACPRTYHVRHTCHAWPSWVRCLVLAPLAIPATPTALASLALLGRRRCWRLAQFESRGASCA